MMVVIKDEEMSIWIKSHGGTTIISRVNSKPENIQLFPSEGGVRGERRSRERRELRIGGLE